jgi:glycosyltransferase involved in cell wall biosynthesis
LLITAPDSRAEATGKLFEYLAAGRPIVALAANNEAARIVRETGTGVAVPPGDVDAIARELVRVVRGQLERAFASRGLERYRYPTPAAAMAEAIEQAIAARAAI